MPDGARVEQRAASPPVSSALFTLPNVITFGRLCAVPLAVWLLLRRDLAAAFWLFVVAGLSDAVDGWLARRQGSTVVGAMLDPVADKALLVAMYVMLAAVGALPDWLAILVVFRDLVIVGGVMALSVLGQKVAIRPLYVSKLNTALQIVLVATTLMLVGLGHYDPRSGPWFLGVLIWAVAATTLASGAAYVWKAARLRQW